MRRWLLALCGVCTHPHDYRERDAAGVLELVCDDCGRRVEAIARTETERAAMREHYPTPVERKARPAFTIVRKARR